MMRLPCAVFMVFAVLQLMHCSRIEPVAGVPGTGQETTNGIRACVVRTDGSPAANAVVRLRRSDYVTKPFGLSKSAIYSAEALTDAQGRFEFTGIDPGAYNIEINDLASSSVLLTHTLTHADTVDFGVATLRPYAAMQGTIDTAGRGDRRLYIQVRGLERIAEIDANGAFSFNDLPAGVFNLHISALDTVAYPEKPLNGIPVMSGDTARVTTILPSPWQSTGIDETHRGSIAIVNSQWVVAGGGYDIWGVSDGCRFVYQARQGDVSITARVNSVENTHEFAKACLMIRESLANNARNVAIEAEPTGDYVFQWRDSTADTTKNGTWSSPVPFPQWLRLERKGDTLNGYYSADGVNWTLEGTRVLFLPADIFVGLAVTSHDSTRLCSAIFDGVRISP